MNHPFWDTSMYGSSHCRPSLLLPDLQTFALGISALQAFAGLIHLRKTDKSDMAIYRSDRIRSDKMR